VSVASGESNVEGDLGMKVEFGVGNSGGERVGGGAGAGAGIRGTSAPDRRNTDSG
jgi:hypothetical protein